ncbi:FtsX-like permease family protein [Cellulomonas fengjieae]|uniref:FtsX-like permease family protein n=1 Tax=Cellulomonas fengjieae TaxID=2819978 RepID=UPI001AAF5A35|nr:ABC transporter permease [Cellulomonas fengjieae]MBO3100563.1 ABC transporter permease [Cellulomonas fengjieae]
MRALLGLGLRLARAGGRVRVTGVVAGNALGVALLLVALAIPAAVYPDGARADPHDRVQVVAIVTFLVVPVAILLLTVGRLSSGTRDRRLASLRLLGLSPARTRLVAATENSTLAAAGAVLGIVAVLAAMPVLDTLVRSRTTWFAGRLAVEPGTAVAVGCGVAALSVVVTLASSRLVRTDPRAARSESARRDPSPWRLLTFGLAVVTLAWVATRTPESVNQAPVVIALLVGALAAAISTALAAPVLGAWAARLLARPRWTAGLLAGRAIQAEPAGAARLVAGIGTTTFLIIAAAGVLGAYESTPQYRYAAQILDGGPQRIWVRSADGSATAQFQPEDVRALSAVPGVHGVVPQHDLTQAGCDPTDPMGCAVVFVGTCAQLDLVMVSTGCRDDRAATITLTDLGAEGWVPPANEVELGGTLDLVQDGTGPPVGVDVSGPPIVQDVSATIDRWVYQAQLTAFVPVGLVADLAGPPRAIDVVADPGTPVQDAVAAVAAERGLAVVPYPMSDYDDVMQVRAVVWTISGVAIGIGLLALALTALDRAAENRRAVARQIAVGVPARTLRTGQLLQTLVPLATSLTLAVGCGLLLLLAYANVGDLPRIVSPATLGAFLSATLVGAVLVSAATLPLVRTWLTGELLRRE